MSQLYYKEKQPDPRVVTEEVDKPDQCRNSERVPALVFFIYQRVGGVSYQQRNEGVVEILRSLLIMFLRLFYLIHYSC